MENSGSIPWKFSERSFLKKISKLREESPKKIAEYPQKNIPERIPEETLKKSSKNYRGRISGRLSEDYSGKKIIDLKNSVKKLLEKFWNESNKDYVWNLGINYEQIPGGIFRRILKGISGRIPENPWKISEISKLKFLENPDRSFWKSLKELKKNVWSSKRKSQKNSWSNPVKKQTPYEILENIPERIPL